MARLKQALATLWSLLWECSKGRHDFVGFTDGKRTLWICYRCLKMRRQV